MSPSTPAGDATITEGAIALAAALGALRDDSGRTMRRITDERPTLIVPLRHAGCLPSNGHTAATTPKRPSRPTNGLGSISRETTVSQSLDRTFAFFSDARNLDILTPPWVGFRILTPEPIDMRQGTLIDYRIRIHGIPIRWRTEITEWEAPHRFVDIQLKGPYRWWRHEHRFEPCKEGTRIIDEVEFRAPLHWISHSLIVERDVGRVFDYRARALKRILGGTNAR